MVLKSKNNPHCLYRGSIYHHRYYPKQHFFRYRFFMFYLDINQIASLSQLSFLGLNRFNLFSFYDQDYLAAFTKKNEDSHQSKMNSNKPGEKLFTALREFLADKKIYFKNPKFFLLAHMRFLGYVYNPVSFYYCYDDQRPICALAEVHNTFNERKIYIIKCNEEGQFDSLVDKDFYVSPFSHPHTQFHFKLTVAAEEIKTTVNQRDEVKQYFNSYFSGVRFSLNSLRLLKFTLLFIPGTLKVTLAIHWQAFILWVKRFPYFAKESYSEHQKDFYTPPFKSKK